MIGAASRTTIVAVMTAVLWLAWTGVRPACAAQRAALVIGNGAYAHAPALANPLNDAADVGAALGRLGFSVTRLENAGYAALRRGLLEFQRAASASEVAVVFYAGHGIEVDRHNFLVPVDARLASDQDVEFEAVPLELVSRAVERASGLRLVILDACRENPFAVNMQRAGATRSIGRGLARVEPSGETLIAYAAKEGTVAADGAGKNSPYTGALLSHLEEPGLEVGLMFRRVRDAVLASTGGRQEPFVYGSLSSRGVYLAAGPPAPALAPPTQPSVANESGSTRVVAESELLFWESVKDSRYSADIEVYLDRYPGGTYAALARNRLKRLEDSAKGAEATVPAPQASSVSARMEEARLVAEAKFWALVEESEDSGDFEAYLEHYPDGVYAPVARIRLRQLERERTAPAAPASSTAVPTPEDIAVAPASSSSQPAMAAVAVPTSEEAESTLGLGRAQRRMVQRGLASLGYGPGPADGLFGAGTREAIRRYQEAKGHEATGYLRGEESGALVSLGEEEARAQAEARREAQRREAERRAEAAQREKKPGRRFRDCAECPELVVVRSGSFMMGSRSGETGRDSDEGPVHRVTIAAPIAVGVSEVTFAQWEACRRGGGCSHNPGDSGWGRGTRPVMNVSWEDAQEYVRWLSGETGERYRLLSESEWEYVARAGTETRYHWGGAVGRNRANCLGCGSRWDGKQTAPVGSFSANGFGLHDVHGNVREWVEDCWHGNYTGAPSDGRAWTRGGDCSARVLRGGSWYFSPRLVRSANRLRLATGYRDLNLGFRVARTMD